MQEMAEFEPASLKFRLESTCKASNIKAKEKVRAQTFISGA